MRKFLFYINILFILGIFACYICEDGTGQIVEIYFGIFQFFTAIILTCFEIFHSEKTIENHLVNYWLLVVLFIIAFVAAGNMPDNIAPAVIFGYPMIIAIYFTYITYLFTKTTNEL